MSTMTESAFFKWAANDLAYRAPELRAVRIEELVRVYADGVPGYKAPESVRAILTARDFDLESFLALEDA